MKVKIFVVTSNSMAPTSMFGDVLLAKSQEHYEPDDIVSYTVGESVITHRIIAVERFGTFNAIYHTKGDANLSSDLSLLEQENILGKVRIIIPKIGYVILLLQSKIFIKWILFMSPLVFSIQLLVRKLRYVQ